MDNLSDSYRQPRTIQLSPDSLVFINGSNILETPEGEPFDIRQDITTVTTSLNIDSVPGTANFTISYPEHRQGKKKYQNLKIMSEVVIYFRGRFQKQKKDNKGTVVSGEYFYPYYQSFWGVIVAITESYSDGVHTLQVSCADILRWWEITNITVNPSLMASAEGLKNYLNKLGLNEKDTKMFIDGLSTVDKNGRTISIFSNIFSGKTMPEIINAMSVISILQMMPISDYLSASTSATSVNSADRKNMSVNQMKYWQSRFEKIGRNIKIFGLYVHKYKDSNGKQVERLDIDMSQTVTYYDAPNKPTTKEIQKKIGNVSTIYQQFPAAPGVAKSERKSQLEIAKELKEAIHFEFFMDVNGDIVFKPPFYNLDVSKSETSVIHDVDISSWSFIQSESEVTTRIDVNGSLASVSPDSQVRNGVAYDPQLALQFGERPRQYSMPWLHSSQQALFWGKAELARLNALISQGTLTIVGRPELRLGYPVFVPSRDAFYYVKGIEHSFTFGGNFTTTLTLVAERPKTDNKLSIFRNVGEIKDEQTAEPGNTIAITDEINNFVKQFYTPEICTPRTKENINVIRPNFVKDLEQGSQDIKGQWTQDNDRFIDPLSDAKEYQITDVEGYKLIGKIGTITYPCFTYGYGQTFTVKGSVDQQKQEEKENAKKAQELGLNQSQYFVVDPNNTMLTLEDIDSKMVDYGKLQSTAEIKDAATQAMNISNWTPNMGPNLPGTQ